jgi:hypothetical protein
LSAPKARLAAQMLLEGELHALLADVVHAREADDVGGDFTARIVASVFALLVDAR